MASDSPLVDGALDRAAHLAVHHAFAAIARALRPALAERAYLTSDPAVPAGPLGHTITTDDEDDR